MLVLTRAQDDAVTITTPEGRVIVVTLVQERRGRHRATRIGFEADPSVSIVRDDAKVKTKPV